MTTTTRGLRVAAIVRWLLLAVVTLVAGYTTWTFWGARGTGGDAEHAAHAPDRYYCPMHPDIRSPDPGECPICHMTLELIPDDRRASNAATHGNAGANGSAETRMEKAVPHPSDVMPISVSVDQQRAVGLTTEVVIQESAGDRLRVPGVVSAPETGLAEVRVRAPGFLEKVAVRQAGVKVSRGQILAWIYSPDIYRAQEEFIAASRWSGAIHGGAGAPPPTKGLSDAGRRGLELYGLSGAEIDEIARTQRPLRAVPVRATSFGTVTRFNAVLGSWASPETTLYEIADLSKVWVIASPHERDVSALAVGTLARFVPTSSGGEAVSAKVALIEPALDEATRTARVRLVIDNKQGTLRPGQFGDVEFELPASKALFVPRDAVIRTGKQEYVYVATSPNRFEPRSVHTGSAREGQVQIIDGVSAGERVVVRGSFMLDSESRLQTSLSSSPR